MTTQEPRDVTPAEVQEQARPNEAAKYRTRLRDTEAERDTLAAKVTALQTQAVTRLIGSSFEVPHPKGYDSTIKVTLTHPDDFARFTGLRVDELTLDDGTIDENKLTDTMTALYTDRPDLFTGPPKTYIPGDAESVTYTGTLKGSRFESAFAPLP